MLTKKQQNWLDATPIGELRSIDVNGAKYSVDKRGNNAFIAPYIQRQIPESFPVTIPPTLASK